MDAQLIARRKGVFWRIHLWAAFIATPFALIGALTGMLYIFTPQIESVQHGHLDRVAPAATRVPLDDLVAAAQRAAPPGASLRYVVTPEHADQSVRAYFGAPGAPGATGAAAVKAKASEGEHAHHAEAATPKPAAQPAGMDHRIPQGSIVYLNPYSGEVLGVQAEMDRFSTWAKRLHSSLLQGNDWRWMLELSTSWLMVMLLTGLYLWWPRRGQAGLPRSGVRGRAGWRQWHAFSGVVLSGMALVILTTGLTWSRVAGDQITTAARWTGQAAPESPKGLRSQGQPGQALLNWQQVWDATSAHAPRIAYQINAPRKADDAWRITNFDRSQPTKRFDLLLDGYSGKALHYRGWESFTAFNKATAVGIPFHRGEFGWWNQALLLVFGIGVLWWLVSGWVMYLKRGRQGALGLPPLLPGAWRSLPVAAWATAAVLFLAMPLLALSAIGVAAVEAVLALRRRRTLAAA